MVTQNEPNSNSYKRYAVYCVPIGIWLITLAFILISEFPSLFRLGFILILVSIIFSAVSMLLEIGSRIKWKPLNWVDDNLDKENYNKHYGFFIYNTVIAWSVFVIYFCVKLLFWPHFSLDDFRKMLLILFLLSSIFLFYRSLKSTALGYKHRPNTYFRIYEIDFNTFSERFVKVLNDSGFLYNSEYHKRKWFIHQYTKYQLKNAKVGAIRNIQIFLIQDKIGTLIVINNIREPDVASIEKLIREIDKVIN